MRLYLWLPIIWICIFTNLIFLSSAHALNLQCMRRLFDYHYQDSSASGQRLGVIDVGSTMVKLFLKDREGTVLQTAYPVSLGRSLGASGAIDAEAKAMLEQALKSAKEDFKAQGFAASEIEIVATAGLRDASNGFEIVKDLKRQGFPVRVISENEESKLVYRSIMKEKFQLNPHALVIEVGGGSTEIVRGAGELEIDRAETQVIHAGAGSLGVKDQFNETELEGAAKKVHELLGTHEYVKANDGTAYLSPNVPMRALRELHALRTGVDIFKEGLSAQLVDFYLSAPGLKLLKDSAEEPLSELPAKLVILREISQQRQIKTLHFGSPGGMKDAVARELEAKLIAAQIDRTTSKMLSHFSQKEQGFSNLLIDSFPPEEFGAWEFRVKARASLENKLTAKWINKMQSIQELRNVKKAHLHISDGLGARLTLRQARAEDLSHLQQKILAGIRNRDFTLVSIHNYQAAGGSPYFSQAQVLELSDVIHQMTGRQPKIFSGATGVKNSGYTAIHFNFLDPSGARFELQVRGQKVSRLAELEHDYYDIREGKSVSALDAGLVHSIQSLNDAEQNAYLDYVKACYIFARKQEQNQIGIAPVLPAILAHHPKLSFESFLSR